MANATKKPTPEFLAREDEFERHIAAAPPLTVVTAEQLYNPVVGNALQLFEAGDFSALDDRYSTLPYIEHRTTWLLWVIIAIEDDVELYGQRYQALVEHNSELSHMLAAKIASEWATRERGTALANTVTETGQQGWDYWLAEAGKHLEAAARASNYEDPLGYAVAQGATINHEDNGHEFFQTKTRAIDPWCALGWQNITMPMDCRWTGDEKILPSLAAYIAQNAPIGHPVLVEVAAMLEQALSTAIAFEELEFDEAVYKVYRDPANIQTLQTAYSKFIQDTHPSPRTLRNWQKFAYSLVLASLHEEFLHAADQTPGKVYAPACHSIRAASRDSARTPKRRLGTPSRRRVLSS